MSSLTEAQIRARERERGMRGRRSKCRLCEADLTRSEDPEGVCDKCLRSHSTYVRTEPAPPPIEVPKEEQK